MTYALIIPVELLPMLVKIREQQNISIRKQILIGIEIWVQQNLNAEEIAKLRVDSGKLKTNKRRSD